MSKVNINGIEVDINDVLGNSAVFIAAAGGQWAVGKGLDWIVNQFSNNDKPADYNPYVGNGITTIAPELYNSDGSKK